MADNRAGKVGTNDRLSIDKEDIIKAIVSKLGAKKTLILKQHSPPTSA